MKSLCWLHGDGEVVGNNYRSRHRKHQKIRENAADLPRTEEYRGRARPAAIFAASREQSAADFVRRNRDDRVAAITPIPSKSVVTFRVTQFLNLISDTCALGCRR